MKKTIPTQLLLKTGEIFTGFASNYFKDAVGEVVFNTGMVGYVESLTDPSYTGQMLCFTYPLIGNYGVSAKETWESEHIQVKGAIFSELSDFHSNCTAEQSLLEWLSAEKIPFIYGVDTRALTHRLRTEGVAMGIMSQSRSTSTQFINFDETNWVEQVTVSEPIYYGKGKKKIILVDCGLKQNILRCLLQFPIYIKRVPYHYDYTEEDYDGVLISNGPGEPSLCQATINNLRKSFAKQKPCFGICLGTQLMGLAAGANTYKLTFGHRSHNQPCMHLPSNKCFLTSQNHGYAIDEASLPADWRLLFRNLNDQSVAGIEHCSQPFFSVQFHPEAAPGPMDTMWLFQRFYESL